MKVSSWSDFEAGAIFKQSDIETIVKKAGCDLAKGKNVLALATALEQCAGVYVAAASTHLPTKAQINAQQIASASNKLQRLLGNGAFASHLKEARGRIRYRSVPKAYDRSLLEASKRIDLTQDALSELFATLDGIMRQSYMWRAAKPVKLSKPGAMKDQAYRNYVKELARIWAEFFGKAAGASVPSVGGKSRGPFIRFARANIKHLNGLFPRFIETRTGDSVRKALRATR